MKNQKKSESRKEGHGKDTLVHGGMVEKDMGERIGGSHLLTKVGCQSRNSIAIDHLSLKNGSVGEGGQKNKSKAANNMEQEGGPYRTGRQKEWDRCAGRRTKKNRRPDLPKWAGGGRFPRVPWTSTCIGRAKEEKYWELRHIRHMEMEQDKELYSNI